MYVIYVNDINVNQVPPLLSSPMAFPLPLSCLCISVCPTALIRVVWISMGGGYWLLQRRIWLPFPQQPLTPLQIGVGPISPFSIHERPMVSVLCRSCVVNHGCCELLVYQAFCVQETAFHNILTHPPTPTFFLPLLPQSSLSLQQGRRREGRGREVLT